MGITPRILAGIMATTATCSLTACVANSSNPTVSIDHARMSDSDASIALYFGNPGGRRLTINSIDYELSHGEVALPIAEGRWTGTIDLAPGGHANLALVVPFDQPPLEPDSRLLHFSGVLGHKDHTGFLGLRSMDLGETAFKLDVEASETAP